MINGGSIFRRSTVAFCFFKSLSKPFNAVHSFTPKGINPTVSAFLKKLNPMPLTRSGKRSYNRLLVSTGRSLPSNSLPADQDHDNSDMTQPSRKRRTRVVKNRQNTEGKTKKAPSTKASATPKGKGNTSTTIDKKDVPTTKRTHPTTPQKEKTTRSPKSRTSSGRKRQRIEPGSLDPPKDWELLYSLVEELRADRTAPLDSDGGEALPERQKGEKVYRYQVLIALMLSSQTKDAVVGEAMRALQEHGLDAENICATDNDVINSLIRKVGFHNNKTKYIKSTSETLVRDYNGDIPSTAEEIMKLPGVGPKMAFIVENIAFGKASGIGVDTHMHRIFNDLKWVKSKTPEETREQLEGWLPKEKWSGVNMLWVGFGQESQQQKEKILKKALACSKPADALKLLKKVGLDVLKEGKKYGLEEDIRKIH